MRVFAMRIKLPDGVPVQGLHHAYAGVHQEVAAFGGADQAGGRCLPFHEPLLGLRQLHDVVGGVLEGDELATAGQRYRILELSRPTLNDVVSPMAVFSWRSPGTLSLDRD